MFRLCVALRSVQAAVKPHLFPIDLTAKHAPGRLYFADRAVKSTSSEPNFVCLDNAMACQSPNSNAAVVLRCCAQRGQDLSQYGRMRFHGCGATFVFRRNRLIFQGLGDNTLQTQELSLRHNDVFALLSGLHPHENIHAWTQAVEKALAEGDVEYVAEEMLLQLRCATEGCTSVVSKVSKFSTGLPEPPICSHVF